MPEQPGPPAGPALPGWLEPVRAAAATLTGPDLSRWLPPEDPPPREGAVLVLFGDGPGGPDVLLTERGHAMRSQPGQVAFPGGSLDPGETHVEAALREAHEETGVLPDEVEVFGVLPRLWLPPRNFAVAPVLGWWAREHHLEVVNPVEVHAVHRVTLEALRDPAHRVLVRHPSGYEGPGWLIGDTHDVLLWGFTAGILDTLLEHAGFGRPWDRSRVVPLPPQALDRPTGEERIR